MPEGTRPRTASKTHGVEARTIAKLLCLNHRDFAANDFVVQICVILVIGMLFDSCYFGGFAFIKGPQVLFRMMFNYFNT